MFPLNDYNVVCCALATFSAAVGYKIARQRHILNILRRSDDVDHRDHIFHRRDSSVSMLSSCDSMTESEASEPPISDCPTPSENAFDDTEIGTLKRKLREEEPEDSMCRAGSARSDSDQSTAPAPKRYKIRNTGGSVSVKTEDVESSIVTGPEHDLIMGDQTELSSISQSLDEQEQPVQQRYATAATFRPLTQPITPVKPSLAFTSFASNPSAFSVVPSTAPAINRRSIWSVPSSTKEIAAGSAAVNAAPTLQDRVNAETSEVISSPIITGTQDEIEKTDDPLAAHHYTKSTIVSLTGEEDEHTKSELKGVKVFIKRGDREFTDGILGNIKHLSHKDTADERLLFRREPVWKVSMSVRLRPTVRCSFDEDQGILRVALKEADKCENAISGQQKQEIVVYAIKRGKASRDDFAQFARSVVSSPRWAVLAKDAEHETTSSAPSTAT